MISKQMVAWGESGSSIREIAAYGERRAAEIGPENVYNFAIGNPSIDPPDCVQEAVERLLPITKAAVQAVQDPGTELGGAELGGSQRGLRGRWVL